jgi:hypothetical protein
MEYQERINHIAERDGLDLIVNELKERGYDAVIDQTGGFVLCVGVHGDAGYLYANEDCVCFYTTDALDGGELIAQRIDEDNEGWAIRVGNIYALNIEKVGRLFSNIERDLLGKLSAKDLEILDFISLEESRRTGVSTSRVQFCINSVYGYGWSLDPMEFSEGLRESFENAGFTNA